MTLIAITLYITYNAIIDYLITLVILIIISILVTANTIGNKITIVITNLYRA